MGQGGQEVLVGPATHNDMATNDITHSQSNKKFCYFLNKLWQGINRNKACKNPAQVIRQGLSADRSDLRPGLPRVYLSSWSSLQGKSSQNQSGAVYLHKQSIQSVQREVENNTNVKTKKDAEAK